ncbi:hypothetical protein EBB07_19790 [Paenibacillaceae bacterium]|nr:hypothetical protein EBB07_19790 [Paenibacillaceae bacterium]
MNKYLKWMLPLFVIALLLAACGSREVQEPNNSDTPAAPGNSQGEPEPVKEEMKIKVYLTDDQLLELTEVEASIAFADEQEKLEAALAALQQDGSEDYFSLWSEIKILSVNVQDGALTVDLEIPDEANLGSSGELLALEAIEKTVFQFEEIKSLDLLVQGEAVDSLMGHMELEHPIERPL